MFEQFSKFANVVDALSGKLLEVEQNVNSIQ